MVEDIAAGGEAARQLAARRAATEPVAAHAVAEAVVPFEEAPGEAAELVAVVAQVPGLGDQPRARQRRVLQQGDEQRGVRVEALAGAAEHAGEVEAKAVDTHGLHPVAQHIERKLHDAWVGVVDGVAAAAEVLDAAGVVGAPAVPGGVVESAPGQRRAALVALGGVVEDDVDDDFDAGLVQRGDHGAEFGGDRRRVGARGDAGQPRLGAEEAQRVVAPVVAQAALGEAHLVEPPLHRQQRQRGHAQPPQVRDGRRVGQRGIAAPQLRRHLGQVLAEILDMGLVEHDIGAGVARRVERARRDRGRRGHAGLERVQRVVAAVHVAVAFGVADDMAEMLGPPAEMPDDLARPGVEQQLVRVVAVAALGLPRPVRAQAVDQPGAEAGQEAVVDAVVRAMQRVAAQLAHALGIEDAQLDALGMVGPDRDVDPAVAHQCAQRLAAAGQQAVGQRGSAHVRPGRGTAWPAAAGRAPASASGHAPAPRARPAPARRCRRWRRRSAASRC